MESDQLSRSKPVRTGTLRMTGRILSFVLPYWPSMLCTFLLMSVTIGLGLVTPRVMEGAVDDINHGITSNLGFYALLIVGATVLAGGLAFLRSWTQNITTGHAMWDMRTYLFDTLQHLSIAYHEHESSGQIISRVIMDIHDVESFYRMVIYNFLEISLAYTITVGYMFHKSWPLTLWSLSTFPLAIFCTVYFSGRMRQRFFEIRQQQGNMTTVLQENLSGVRVVRAFAQEDTEISKFDRDSAGIIRKAVEAARVWTTYHPIVTYLLVISMALTFLMGSRMVATGLITIGLLSSFFWLQQGMAWRLGNMGRMFSHFQRALAAGDRVFEVLDRGPKVPETRHAPGLKPGPGHVVFEHVNFTYEPGGRQALTDINLDVAPGKMVALVGATGSGKSTLVSLLPRFYDVSSGRILIDDVDIREVKLQSLRSEIGIVFQESFLFSTSVAENISYGNPEADIQAIRESARVARADDFISHLPQGYDTVIGERGVTLSGGQKQRLTIARALLREPRILVLDDSTSSVDPATEHEIHQAMIDVAENRTTFVIAHRLSTVRRADLIVVLDNGHIAETGTHEQLLARGGLYKRIYDVQFSTGTERTTRSSPDRSDTP